MTRNMYGWFMGSMYVFGFFLCAVGTVAIGLVAYNHFWPLFFLMPFWFTATAVGAFKCLNEAVNVALEDR